MMILARIIPLLSTFVLWALLVVTQETDALRVNRGTKKILRCKRPNGGKCSNDGDCGRLKMCENDMCVCEENKCWLKKQCGEACSFDVQCMDAGGICDGGTMKCECNGTSTGQTPMSTTEAPTAKQPTTIPTTPGATTTMSCEEQPYVFDSTKRTWDDSKKYCDDNGMQIGMFKSDGEVETFKFAIKNCLPGPADYWIGMKQDPSAYLVYNWVDNTVVAAELKSKFQWQDTIERKIEGGKLILLDYPDDLACMNVITMEHPMVSDQGCAQTSGVVCKKIS